MECLFKDLFSAVLERCGVVYVDLFGDADGCVAESAGDAFCRGAVLDESRGVCVAEGVRVESFTLQEDGEAARADELAGFIGADEVELGVAIAQLAGSCEHSIVIDVEVIVREVVREDDGIACLHDLPGGKLGEELSVDADCAGARGSLRGAEVIAVQARDIYELMVDGDGLALEVNIAPAQAEGFSHADASVVEEHDGDVELCAWWIGFSQHSETLWRYDGPLDDLLGRLGRDADVLRWIAADDAGRVDGVL